VTPIPAEAHNLLLELLRDIEQTSLLWQLGVIAASLGLAWWASRLARQRLEPGAVAGGVARLIFPITALGGVLLGKALLQHSLHTSLLNLAVPLLVSLALIRISFYVLRHIFAPGGWLQASERFIAWLVWIVLALHITGFLPELLHLLDELGFNLGRQRISLLLLIQGMLSIVVTLMLALWLGSLLEARIMRAEGLDPNMRVLATKFVRAGLLVLGVLIALPAVGIDVTVLSVFGGALGVGLGFGLQKIASNYVSGFIILLDKSIHLGDIVTADNRHGMVTSLTARYMVLKELDGTEAIIPNEILITSSVVNHSYSDRKIRVAVPVQVSYASPLETAMRIMLQAGESHPRVIADPEPKVLLKEFADNGINLELAVWIADPEEGMSSLRSDINLQIWHQFQQQGIEIPFPQRDIRLVDQPAQT
jgi:small-conductance mechanosensitive channel